VVPEPQDDPQDVARHDGKQKVLRQTRIRNLEGAKANLKELTDEASNDRVQILAITSTFNRLTGKLELEDELYTPSDKFKKRHENARDAYEDKRILHLNIHRGKVFAIIRGQCTPALLQKLKADPSWKEVAKNN
jgi:hypothetical protein